MGDEVTIGSQVMERRRDSIGWPCDWPLLATGEAVVYLSVWMRAIARVLTTGVSAGEAYGDGRNTVIEMYLPG